MERQERAGLYQSFLISCTEFWDRPATQTPVLIDTSADKNNNGDDKLDSDDFQSS